MYDQILDTFRKAAESTLQMQQEMFRNWTQQWTQNAVSAAMPALPHLGTAWLDQLRALQKTWSSSVTEMLNKHRQALDAQYKAGIDTIDQAFKVGEARTPEQFRKLTEELWKHSFDTFRTLTEAQMRDFQGAADKWLETVSKGMSAVKV
jgi:rubrerythrin